MPLAARGQASECLAGSDHPAMPFEWHGSSAPSGDLWRRTPRASPPTYMRVLHLEVRRPDAPGPPQSMRLGEKNVGGGRRTSVPSHYRQPKQRAGCVVASECRFDTRRRRSPTTGAGADVRAVRTGGEVIAVVNHCQCARRSRQWIDLYAAEPARRELPVHSHSIKAA